MSTFEEIHPEFEIWSKVKTALRCGFEWTYPLQASGVDPCASKVDPRRPGTGDSNHTLKATQGQFDGFSSQLPYKCHQNRVASV